jgi:general secretion pathway protein D
LFGSDRNETNKTEIVLLITPRVVRNIVRPERVASEFAGGTENASGVAPLSIRATRSGAIGIAPQGKPEAASNNPPAPVPIGAVVGAAPVKPTVGGSTQAALGREFAIAVNFPPEVRAADFDLVYEPALVTSLARPNPAEPDPGRIRLHLENPAGQSTSASVNATFRVIAKTVGAAELKIENLNATGDGGAVLPIAASDAFAVAIVP